MDCVQWYIQTSWLWLHSSYLGDFLLKSYLVTPGGGKPYRSRWFISLHLPGLCKLDCELRFLLDWESFLGSPIALLNSMRAL